MGKYSMAANKAAFQVSCSWVSFRLPWDHESKLELTVKERLWRLNSHSRQVDTLPYKSIVLTLFESTCLVGGGSYCDGKYINLRIIQPYLYIACNRGVNRPGIIGVLCFSFSCLTFSRDTHPQDSHFSPCRMLAHSKLSFPSDELVLRWEREKRRKNKHFLEVCETWFLPFFPVVLKLSPYLFQEGKFLCWSDT